MPLWQRGATGCVMQNFMAHAAGGTYTGTWFHRILPGFMAQGGDPTGTGKGGEAVGGGYLSDEFCPELRHSQRGVVSMAKPAGSSKNGSQFFITFSAQPHLDDEYTVIGHVIGSEDALSGLEEAKVTSKGRPASEADRVLVTAVVVHANPFAVSDGASVAVEA
jgi:peptidyl-prolyl cis-trans isomerase-like 3